MPGSKIVNEGKNINMKLLPILLCLLPYLLNAQTPYAFSFYWKGKITGKSAFELRINMFESDKLISGQGSRLKGECIFLNDYSIYLIEGIVKNDEITLNCLDKTGKMAHSFIFPKADGRQQRQLGKWTNGIDKAEAYLETKSGIDIPNSQLLGFSVGINVRRNQLEKDSLVANLIKTISQIPFLPIGEGYRLDKFSFLRSDYYGTDYLEFSDTVVTKDSSFQITKLAWQLLPSSKNSPYLLELKTRYWENRQSVLTLSVFNFQGGKWINIDSSAIPMSYNLVQLKFHENYKYLFNGNNSLFIFRKDQKKLLIWRWEEDKFIEE